MRPPRTRAAASQPDPEASDQPTDPDTATTAAPRTGLSRRGLLTTSVLSSASGLLVGAAAGTGTTLAVDNRRRPDATASSATSAQTGNQRSAYYGPHPPGIVAPQQSHYRLAAFDLTDQATIQQTAALLRTWSAIAAACMAAQPTADDDAMATGRGPANLTITLGLGASLLTRLGLAAQIPAELGPIPAFPADRLDPASGGGDLMTLIGGTDGIVVAHAFRALVRATGTTAAQRWQISGFSDSPGAIATPASTPRNLMGQLDGTDNPTPAQAGFDAKIYTAADSDPSWMRGGSYLVVRRIRMLLEDWDTLTRAQQQNVIGRRKDNGAPLSGGTEHTTPDYVAQSPDGALLIPPDAHIRLANPTANLGATILRRGFSYDRGVLPDGAPDAGLLFLAYQGDPRTGFIPIQQKLSEADALSNFIVHESSALFAVPAITSSDDYPARSLLTGSYQASGVG
jgi:dye decolorizing peroxidase